MKGFLFVFQVQLEVRELITPVVQTISQYYLQKDRAADESEQRTYEALRNGGEGYLAKARAAASGILRMWLRGATVAIVPVAIPVVVACAAGICPLVSSHSGGAACVAAIASMIFACCCARSSRPFPNTFLSDSGLSCSPEHVPV